jgi:hypothetical protein
VAALEVVASLAALAGAIALLRLAAGARPNDVDDLRCREAAGRWTPDGPASRGAVLAASERRQICGFSPPSSLITFT